MARKRHHEEHVNHEAWAIPYGDLITLLLAFFVVMYALSSVNEGKYRVLSDSLVAAFRSAPKSLEPIQVGDLSRAFHEVQADRPRTLVPLEIDALLVPLEEPGDDAFIDWGLMRHSGNTPDMLQEAASLVEDISAALADELASLLAEDLVHMRTERYWLEIEINTSVLFDTASATLEPAAQGIVRRIGEILGGTETRIQVEGHTDIRPINTPAFASNWELSAARAASVVRLMSQVGVEPARMAAVGFGEFQPVAGNDTPEGQAQNRRVVIVVMAGRDRAPGEAWRSAGSAARESWTAVPERGG